MIGRIVFVWLIFSGLIAVGQQWTQEDILELKDGKFMYGKIIRHIPNKEVHLKTADSSFFVIPSAEIAVLRRGPYTYRRPAYQLDKSYSARHNKSVYLIDSSDLHKSKGFAVFLKGGFLFLNSYSANLTIGRLMNPYILLTLGSGLEKYTNFGNSFIQLRKEGVSAVQVQEDYFIPILVSARFFTSPGRMSFTSNLEAGYSIYLSNFGTKQTNGTFISESLSRKVQSGGFLAATSIGLRVYASKNTSFIYEIGVKAQAYLARQIRLTNPSSNTGSFSSTTVFLSNTEVWNIVPFVSFGISF